MSDPNGTGQSAQYPELARLVRQAMTPVDELGSEGRRMTARAAARLTGVSLGTINSMAHGIRPKASILLRFAQALGVPATPLIAAAGYVPEQNALEIADADEARVVARYRNLPPDKQRVARRLLAALSEEGDDFDGYDEGDGDPPPPSTRAG